MKTHKGYILVRTANEEAGGLKFRRGFIVEDKLYSIHRSDTDGGYVITDLPTGMLIKSYKKLKDARRAIEDGDIDILLNDYKLKHPESYQDKVKVMTNLINCYKEKIFRKQSESEKYLKFDDINEKYFN